MQIDVDIGSSSVARSVIGLVLGYVTSLVVDLGILIEVCAIVLVMYVKLDPFFVVICAPFCVDLQSRKAINFH